MSKFPNINTVAGLPNGSLVTAVSKGGVRITAYEGTAEQLTADTNALYDMTDSERDKVLGFKVCPTGKSLASGHNSERIRKREGSEKLDDWDIGQCPDLKGKTLNDLDDMARTGWAKGVERLAEFTASLESSVPVPESIRSRYEWTDDGEDYDVLRTYAGDFDSAFGTYRPAVYRGPRVVTLYVQVGGHAGEDWERMFWRAAPAVAVFDVLSKAGFDVEIYGVSAEGFDGGSMGVRKALVKRAGEHMNLASAAYLLCMTAWFRMYGFRLNAFNPFEHHHGWGRPLPLTSDKVTSIFDAMGWQDDPSTVAVRFDTAKNEPQARKSALKALRQLADEIDLEIAEGEIV